MAKPAAASPSYAAAPEPEAFSIGLHYEGGGSDKVYNVSIQPVGDAWVVNFSNGRRGGTLAHGTKTNAPVPYDQALKACNKLIAEKVGKGYVPVSGSRLVEGATAEVIATVERRSSGFVPQLANPVQEDEVERLLRDPAYVMQQKHDGERRPVIVEGGAATGGNRKGQTVALSTPVSAALLALGRDVRFDCEQVGDVLHVFDLVAVGRLGGGEPMRDVSHLPFGQRMQLLAAVDLKGSPNLVPSLPVVGEAAKREVLARLRESRTEGVVFKRNDAPYVPGRPNSGGDHLKFKFYNTLSAVVSKVNDRRSVSLSLVDGDRRVEVGNVTIPSNHPIPDAGSVVEVRYRHAHEGGALQEPTYLGKRSDVDVEECRADQRVFKGAVPRHEEEPEPSAPTM